MRITKVTEQKNKKNRVSVFVDEKFAFGMTLTDALYYHIKEGEEITPERYNIILEELVYAKARDKAVRLLGFGRRTERELFNRLSEDYSEEICQRVIDMLKGYGYIDDAAYARAYVSDGFRLKGKGARRIASELKIKGVAEEEIAAALSSAELNEEEKAAELLKKRLKGNTSPDYKERSKQYNYLMGRGFSHEAIQSAFSQITEDSDL